MKIIETKQIFFAAALIALLLIAIPASAQQPACPTQGRTQTWTFTEPGGGQSVYVNLPKSAYLCPNESTGGCCDKVEVTGLTPGWKISGFVKLFYLFTTKYPAGDPRQREEFLSFNIPLQDIVSSKFVVNGICYPPSHGWPSAEVHVDVQLVITDASGVRIPWIGGDPNIPGTIGPGSPGGGWDPVCYNLGCTPGYWKTHPNAWPNPPLDPGTKTFYAVFGKYASWDESLLLIEGADAKGSLGQDANMVRQCSAAYVGAVWHETVYNNSGNCYAYSTYLDGEVVDSQDIIDWVKAAYVDGSKSAFAAAQKKCSSLNENSICGPNGPWLNTETGVFGGPACLLPSGIPATPKLIP